MIKGRDLICEECKDSVHFLCEIEQDLYYECLKCELIYISRVRQTKLELFKPENNESSTSEK
jgi:hypothetical protein